MFTGLIEEGGADRRRAAGAEGARLLASAPRRCWRASRWATRSRSTAPASPPWRSGADGFAVDAWRRPCAAPRSGARGRRPGQPGAADAPGRPPRRPPRAGARGRRGPCPRSAARGRARARDRAPRGAAALHRREGQHRRRRCQPDRGRAPGRRLHGRPDPAHMDITTLGPRRRRARVNLEVDVVAKYVESLAAPYAPPREGRA